MNAKMNAPNPDLFIISVLANKITKRAAIPASLYQIFFLSIKNKVNGAVMFINKDVKSNDENPDARTGSSLNIRLNFTKSAILYLNSLIVVWSTGLYST